MGFYTLNSGRIVDFIQNFGSLVSFFVPSDISVKDWGYPHDGSAIKNLYLHDHHANKDSYLHDCSQAVDLCSFINLNVLHSSWFI